MFRASSVPIIRSYQPFTWQLVCFMQFIWSLPRRARLEQPDSPRQRTHNLHETYQLPRVRLITPDDGQRRCPKHVEFRDKIKFWILEAPFWSFTRTSASCLLGPIKTLNLTSLTYLFPGSNFNLGHPEYAARLLLVSLSSETCLKKPVNCLLNKDVPKITTN